MSRRFNQFNFKDLFTSNPEDVLGVRCANDSAVDSASQGNSQYNYSQTDQLFDSQDGQQMSHSQNFPQATDSPTTRFFNRYMSRASAVSREGCQPPFGKPFAASGVGLPRRPSQQQIQLCRTKSQESDESRDLWNCLISSIKECSAEVRVAVACLKENTQMSLGATECKLSTFVENIRSDLEKHQKSIFDALSGHDKDKAKDSKIEELEKLVQKLEKEKQDYLALSQSSAYDELWHKMKENLEVLLLQNRDLIVELYSAQEQRFLDASETLKNSMLQGLQGQQECIRHSVESYRSSYEMLYEKLKLEKDSCVTEIQKLLQSSSESQNLSLEERCNREMKVIFEKEEVRLTELFEHQYKLLRASLCELFQDSFAGLTSKEHCGKEHKMHLQRVTEKCAPSLEDPNCQVGESLNNPDCMLPRLDIFVSKDRTKEITAATKETSLAISETHYPSSMRNEDALYVIDLTKDVEQDEARSCSEKMSLIHDSSVDPTNLPTPYNRTSVRQTLLCNSNVSTQQNASTVLSKQRNACREDEQQTECFEMLNSESSLLISPMPSARKRYLDQPENLNLKANSTAEIMQKQCKKLELKNPNSQTEAARMIKTPAPSFATKSRQLLKSAEKVRQVESNILCDSVEAPQSMKTTLPIGPKAKSPLCGFKASLHAERKPTQQQLIKKTSLNRTKKAKKLSLADRYNKDVAGKLNPFSSGQYNRKKHVTKTETHFKECVATKIASSGIEIFDFHDDTMDIDSHSAFCSRMNRNTAKKMPSKATRTVDKDMRRITRSITAASKTYTKVVDNGFKENVFPVSNIPHKEIKSSNTTESAFSIFSDDKNVFESWIESNDFSTSSTSASSSPSFSICEILKRSEI